MNYDNLEFFQKLLNPAEKSFPGYHNWASNQIMDDNG